MIQKIGMVHKNPCISDKNVAGYLLCRFIFLQRYFNARWRVAINKKIFENQQLINPERYRKWTAVKGEGKDMIEHTCLKWQMGLRGKIHKNSISPLAYLLIPVLIPIGIILLVKCSLISARSACSPSINDCMNNMPVIRWQINFSRTCWLPSDKADIKKVHYFLHGISGSGAACKHLSSSFPYFMTASVFLHQDERETRYRYADQKKISSGNFHTSRFNFHLIIAHKNYRTNTISQGLIEFYQG